MDGYDLRSRTQVRVPATDRQTDTLVGNQSVDKTITQSDTRVATCTDFPMMDQTVDQAARSVPSSMVVPTQSGDTLSSHARTSPSESAEQRVSMDSTVDLVQTVTPDFDHQTDRTSPSGDTGRNGPPSQA